MKKIFSLVVKEVTNEFSLSEDWLLDDDNDYTFYPIKRPALIKYMYEQRELHWVPSDIDMRTDRHDYNHRCDDNMRTFLNGILALFAPLDGLVGENIDNFKKDTSFWKECRAFYSEQGSMETIHGEMYSLMAQVLIRDVNKRKEIFDSIKTYPSVGKIAAFMKKYMDRSYSLAERIIAFACVEGVLFNSAFAAIHWLKKKNILRGLCKANEFICRDEGIHTRFAVTLYLMVTQRIQTPPASPDRVLEIIQECVKVNEEFMKEILIVEMIGMSSTDMINYIKCTADALAVSLGHSKIYNIENPFDWMAIISLPNKTNFFEDKVSEYSQKAEGEFIFDESAYF